MMSFRLAKLREIHRSYPALKEETYPRGTGLPFPHDVAHSDYSAHQSCEVSLVGEKVGITCAFVHIHTHAPLLLPSLHLQETLSLVLRGRSIRPVCHFALEEFPDYLQRRQSHLLANELGQQGLAIESASVRVMEVISRGTHMRNTRRCGKATDSLHGTAYSRRNVPQRKYAWLRCFV